MSKDKVVIATFVYKIIGKIISTIFLDASVEGTKKILKYFKSKKNTVTIIESDVKIISKALIKEIKHKTKCKKTIIVTNEALDTHFLTTRNYFNQLHAMKWRKIYYCGFPSVPLGINAGFTFSDVLDISLLEFNDNKFDFLKQTKKWNNDIKLFFPNAKLKRN